MQFYYEAVDSSGGIVEGKIDAEYESSALAQLQNQGYMVMELQERRTFSLSNFFQVRRKVKIGELAIFSRQLAAMINAGVPLTRSLYVLSEQSSNPTLQKALEDIARNVEGGMSFSEALTFYPNIFSNLYLGMIRAGEIGGTLENTLYRLSEQLQKEKNLSDSVKSAAFYPTVVAVFALSLLFLMLVFLVPVFVGLFPEDAVLPLPTLVIITLSDSLRGHWYIWFAAIAILVFSLRYYIKSPSGLRSWDNIRYRLPVFGSLFHRVLMARFSRTFSTLLSGGISVVQALETAGPASGSLRLERALETAVQRIQEGRSLVGPLRESGLFPPMVLHMIGVGEETGELPGLLTRIAEFYEEEVETMTKGLTALVEPLMLIIVGVLVGGILIALYMPIFTVMTEVV